MDPLLLFQRRRVRRLLNLINHLPRNTHFTEAISLDEEHAEAVARAPQEKREPYRPPMHAWSMEAQMLATVIDRLGALQHILVAVNSKKGAGEPPKPYPVPLVALERIRHQVRMQKHQSLVARVKRQDGRPSMDDPRNAPQAGQAVSR